MTTIQAEFDRLAGVFARIGCPIKKAPPVSETQLASVANITGIEIDDSLKDLWRISNGSRRYYWFADGDDEDFTPHIFLPIKEALSCWQLFAPYDEAIYAEWYDDESWGKRDSRIQRHFLRHSKWLGFAEFGGYSQLLQFDGDPTSKGEHGQVILYSYDPDGIFWRHSSFLAFFEKSNDLLEELADDPEFLAEKLLPFNSGQPPHPGLVAPETCHSVEFNFDGIRVTWPESAKGSASDSQVRSNPSNPLENKYSVYDLRFILRITHGNLTFEDDGLEFEFGTVDRGDHIRVAGYNEIYVNGKLRKPHTT